VDFAELVAGRRSGKPPDPLAAAMPNAITGAEGLAFIDACIESTRTRTWVTVQPVTAGSGK
jgi:hypothetical protein